MRLLVLLFLAARASATPYLGVLLEPAEGGARIAATVPGSPAEKAGLMPGATIVGFEGASVRAPADVIDGVAKRTPGEVVRVALASPAGPASVAVTLAERPPEVATALLGRPAPAFALARSVGPYPADHDGLRGSVVVLDFSATWCAPCRAIEPRLARLHAKHERAGLRIVSVSSEPLAALAAHRAASALTWAFAEDEGGALAARFLVSRLPTLVLIDARGIVRAVLHGAGAGRLEAEVEALLAEGGRVPAAR